MSERKNFNPMLYQDWNEAIDEMSEHDQAEFFKAIRHFPNYEPQTSERSYWIFLRGQLKKQLDTYIEKCEKNQRIAYERERRKTSAHERSEDDIIEHECIRTYTNVDERHLKSKSESISKSISIKDIQKNEQSEPDGFALANQEKKVSKEKSFEENDFPKIVEIYNNVTKGVFPQIKVMNADRVKKTRKWAHSLYKAHNCKDKEDFFLQTKKYFDDACRVPFLRGDNGNWKADYEYLISQKCLTKMLEGSYQPEPKQVKPSELHDWQKERDEYYARQKAQSLGLSATNNKPINCNQHFEPLQHGEAIKAFLGAKQ